jgi:hypothetical protein
MEQRDYLIDQLNQLLRVLSNTLQDFIGLKNQGKVNEGIGVVSNVLQNELGFDIDGLMAIPPNELIKTLQEKKRLNHESFEVLASIMLAIADELSAVNLKNEQARSLYSKSLSIYEYLNKASSTYSLDRQLKIEKIKSHLNIA